MSRTPRGAVPGRCGFASSPATCSPCSLPERLLSRVGAGLWRGPQRSYSGAKDRPSPAVSSVGTRRATDCRSREEPFPPVGEEEGAPERWIHSRGHVSEGAGLSPEPLEPALEEMVGDIFPGQGRLPFGWCLKSYRCVGISNKVGWVQSLSPPDSCSCVSVGMKEHSAGTFTPMGCTSPTWL